MVGYHQILGNKNHKIVNMVGWPTLVKYVIFMIFVQAYLNDAYHVSTPPLGPPFSRAIIKIQDWYST